MNSSTALGWILYPWLALALVWLIAAFWRKQTVRRELARTRIVEMFILVPAAFLLFARHLDIGFLAWRFIPDSAAMAWTGLALTAAGIGFAMVARLYLGRNWSGRVTIKENHELIRRGPYRFVRHPIYCGLLFALLATALVTGEVRALFGFALAVAGLRYKAGVEEQFLSETFGAEYARYRQQVRAALIPFLL